MANQPNPSPPKGRRRLSRNAMQSIGWLLTGLLIGLLIGWVIWPVEWTDANLENLRPDARSQFVSATADAYVASGGQDPSTALARMQSFADPQAVVFEAIAFYRQSNDPKRAIREVNLRSLASALGAQTSAANALATSQTAKPDIGWLNWAFGLLTALVLLAGGIWIGHRAWAEMRATQPAPVNESPPAANRAARAAPQPHTPAPSPTVDSNPGWQPSAPDDQLAGVPLDQTQRSSQVVVETWDSPDEAPSFDEPDFLASSRTGVHPQEQPADDEDEIQRITPGGNRPAALFETDEADAELGDTDGFIDFAAPEEMEEESTGAWDVFEAAEDPAAASQAEDEDGGWVNDVDAIGGSMADLDFDIEFDEVMRESDDRGVDAGPQTAATVAPWVEEEHETTSPPSPPADEQTEGEEGTGLLPTVQGVLSTFRRGEGESSSTRDGTEVGVFTAEYHAGILAYEQSFTIPATGSEDDTPLGACGMGISEKLDTSAAHSNNVRVLDVWLYDGVAVRSFNQYLISPGMNKEALANQAKSSGTITGEPLEITPGLTFRIAAKHLTLECRVTNADFLDSSAPPYPLRHVRIEMTARSVG